MITTKEKGNRMPIDELLMTREKIEKYEKAKENYFRTFLKNIRNLKTVDDEEQVKLELQILIKMLPRMFAVIDDESAKFSRIKDVIAKIKMQKGFLEQINYYAHKYVETSEKTKLNEYYNVLYELMNKFIKFCELIEKSRLEI